MHTRRHRSRRSHRGGSKRVHMRGGKSRRSRHRSRRSHTRRSHRSRRHHTRRQRGGLFSMVSNKLKQLQQTHLAPVAKSLSPAVNNMASKMMQHAANASQLAQQANTAIAKGSSSMAQTLAKKAVDAHAAVNTLGDQIISHPSVTGATAAITNKVQNFTDGVNKTVQTAVAGVPKMAM
jgi:hypothetical protein